MKFLGGAVTHDAFHLTAVDQSGEQVRRCFILCLERSGIDANDVGSINAHGTGTRLNDEVEISAIDALFPDSVSVYSEKPFIGHCMTASASIELLIASLTYEHGKIPAPPLVGAANPRLLESTAARPPGPTLCSSLGLGGFNSVIAIDEPISRSKMQGG